MILILTEFLNNFHFYRMFKIIIIFAIRVLFCFFFSVILFKSVTEHCTSDIVCTLRVLGVC